MTGTGAGSVAGSDELLFYAWAITSYILCILQPQAEIGDLLHQAAECGPEIPSVLLVVPFADCEPSTGGTLARRDVAAEAG